MQVSVEPVSGLMRKMTVVLPVEKVDEQFSLRIKKLAKTAQIRGFRPGHAPLHEVEKRFGSDVRDEVARELIQSTMFDVFAEKELVPVNRPNVESYDLAKGQDFKFTVLFEVYPEINLKPFDEKAAVELYTSEVADTDVDKVISDLRNQHRSWAIADRPVEASDRLHVDIEIFHDNAPMSEEPLRDHMVEMDAPAFNSLFKEKLLGVTLGETIEVVTQFDDKVEDKSLIGKEGTFKITIKKIEAPVLPELDDALAKKSGITEGGVEALKQDIRSHLEWQLEREIATRNRRIVFDKYLENNKIELPTSMIDEEIGHMRHDFYHRVSGAHHTHDEKIPEFPREWFESEATRRIHLGLVLSEYIKINQLVVDTARVDAMIEKMTERYEDPLAAAQQYRKDKKQMQSLEMLAMEEMACEQLQKTLTTTEKAISYQEVFEKNKAPMDLEA